MLAEIRSAGMANSVQHFQVVLAVDLLNCQRHTLSPDALTALISLPREKLSRTLGELIKQGFCEESVSLDDRRKRDLAVTDVWEVKLNRANEAMISVLADGYGSDLVHTLRRSWMERKGLLGDHAFLLPIKEATMIMTTWLCKKDC